MPKPYTTIWVSRQRICNVVKVSDVTDMLCVLTGELWHTTLWLCSTGSTIGSIPSADYADVDSAVQAASEALPAWRDTPASKRAGLLRKMADLVSVSTAISAEIPVIIQQYSAVSARLWACSALHWQLHASSEQVMRDAESNAKSSIKGTMFSSKLSASQGVLC